MFKSFHTWYSSTKNASFISFSLGLGKRWKFHSLDRRIDEEKFLFAVSLWNYFLLHFMSLI